MGECYLCVILKCFGAWGKEVAYTFWNLVNQSPKFIQECIVLYKYRIKTLH